MMKSIFLLFFNIMLAGVMFAQGVSKNGKITSTGSEFVSRNGAIGASSGVNKNGKLQAALSVGSSYQGGIIFYFFVSGDQGYVAGQSHGLIASTADLADAVWGCYASLAVAGTVSTIGYGNANTNAIVSGCTTAGIAAQVCSALSLNGYSDWYLPSINELLVLVNNSASVGGFVNGAYSSSSQDNTSGFNSQNFFLTTDVTNKVMYNMGKNNLNHVRPIRSF